MAEFSGVPSGIGSTSMSSNRSLHRLLRVPLLSVVQRLETTMVALQVVPQVPVRARWSTKNSQGRGPGTVWGKSLRMW